MELGFSFEIVTVCKEMTRSAVPNEIWRHRASPPPPLPQRALDCFGLAFGCDAGATKDRQPRKEMEDVVFGRIIPSIRRLPADLGSRFVHIKQPLLFASSFQLLICISPFSPRFLRLVPDMFVMPEQVYVQVWPSHAEASNGAGKPCPPHCNGQTCRTPSGIVDSLSEPRLRTEPTWRVLRGAKNPHPLSLF